MYRETRITPKTRSESLNKLNGGVVEVVEVVGVVGTVEVVV